MDLSRILSPPGASQPGPTKAPTPSAASNSSLRSPPLAPSTSTYSLTSLSSSSSSSSSTSLPQHQNLRSPARSAHPSPISLTSICPARGRLPPLSWQAHDHLPRPLQPSTASPATPASERGPTRTLPVAPNQTPYLPPLELEESGDDLDSDDDELGFALGRAEPDLFAEFDPFEDHPSAYSSANDNEEEGEEDDDDDNEEEEPGEQGSGEGEDNEESQGEETENAEVNGARNQQSIDNSAYHELQDMSAQSPSTVDLTDSSPPRSLPDFCNAAGRPNYSTKRPRRLSCRDVSAGPSAHPNSSGSGSSDNNNSRNKRRRLFNGSVATGDSQAEGSNPRIEQIDLFEENDEQGSLQRTLQKQRADQIAAQNRNDHDTADSSAHTSATAEEGGGKGTRLTRITCSICMEQMHEMVATVCGHLFCRACLHSWTSRPTPGYGRSKAPTCPSCRTPIANKGANNRSIALEFKKRQPL